MSVSAVEGFLAHVSSDAVLRTRLASMDSNTEVVSVAREAGFVFTEAEYEKKLDETLGLDTDKGPLMSGISNCPSRWP